MYNLNIHNITEIKLGVTKLFNNFSSRNLLITVQDSQGQERVHSIGLYGLLQADLIPTVSTEVVKNYTEDDGDYNDPDT
jgi:hypothetical protein